VDRITREKLKHDRFAEEVSHSVAFFGEHHRQFTIYGSIAAVVVVVGAGIYYYNSSQHSQRQAELKEAIRVQDASVGPGSSEFIKSFPTQTEKDKAALKVFADLANKYPTKDEGFIGKYYLGIINADQGKFQEAAKHFQSVISDGGKEYAALARLSLAQIYESQGKIGEAERLLRHVVDNPTTLVSKEQATISLAKVLAKTKPDEARKLLEPLRTERSAVSRAAIQAISDLPRK